MEKWSNHCSDKCPYCGRHTGNWAFTYAFNFAFMECQFCGGISQSAFVDMVEFQWTIPDHHNNAIWQDVHRSLRSRCDEIGR